MVSRTPLRVLPLEYFLSSDGTPVPRGNPLKTSTKRSRSPTAMLSPAKRRILREEGCLTSPSLQPMKSAGHERSSPATAYVRNRYEDRGSPMLVDSPRYNAGGSPCIDAVAYRTRSRASPTKSSSPTKAQPRHPRSAMALDTPISIQRVGTALMVPREIPPRPDPQSIHYPGFDIYYDTHIEIPSTSTRYVPDPELARDKEGMKENLPPRRVTKKPSVTFEVGPVNLYADAPGGKPHVQSYPATPFRKTPLRASMTPVSRSGTKPREFSPGKFPFKPGSRLEKRRTMQEEADGEFSDEEDA